MRRIVVCTTCKYSSESKFAPDGRTGGEMLTGHLQASASAEGIQVVTQACLWNCTRPCSVLIQDDARYSYVTGGHEPTQAQAEAIVAWFKLHGASARGEVSFKDWPDRMRGHFIARIPPVTA